MLETMVNKESFSKNHGLQRESKIKLKRKISSLKSTLNVIIKINSKISHQEFKTYRNS